MAESTRRKIAHKNSLYRYFILLEGVLLEYLEFYAWDIKQGELHAPPFEQTGQHPAFIAAEREVFGQDVSVALFEFPYQPALGTISATEQRAGTYIVRENSQEQGILAEATEKGVSAEQVGTQERVRLPFGHTCRKPLSFQQAMTVTDIRIPTAPMPALEVFHAAHSTFEA